MRQKETRPEEADLLLQEAIDNYFTESAKVAKTINPHYETLWEELHRVVNTGGKRVRPKMCLLAYRAFGGDDIKKAITVATAIELLHQCLLIHDDIIDRDFVRHGGPNIAGVYQKHYKKIVENEQDRTHYASSAALLAGDLLLAGSYQLISQSKFPDETKHKIQEVISRGIFEVAGGELLDTESAFRPHADIGVLVIARYKTAGYTFIAPLLAGALMAGMQDMTGVLERFGAALGVGFQLRDDVLSVFGNPKKTGKPNDSDILEGKYTYMIDCFYKEATDQQIQTFELAFGNAQATDLQINEAKTVLKESGALDATQMKIADLQKSALKALDELPIDSVYRAEFERLISRALERDY